ncbi:immunoglobulin superfamily member 2-like isoform X2 [Prinia subflava]|uniref:immunoglobulin superfamily member 2-like isoform X2 n=1 Tax=Prinia subflava TaxID=208062 RepID=UPI002FE195CC
MGLAQCLAAAFLFLLLLGLTAAQRVVTVQKGPLYRTEGSHVTLWCKVSGYQGPAEQNFQWSIYLPSAPEREVQIVSTVDPSFPYAIYTQRVRGRGIFVERLRGDAVLLHITELQERDAGQYECHTPNTDERYFGSYSAKMDLAVIPDTLSASMAPQALTLMEGDAVELTCEVSKSTAQHTHLSVGWYLLQGAGEHHAEEILTLSKDFILKPGPSYEQRFLQGAVQLNKVGNTTYKLLIGGVTPSDQGQLYCEAAEWIEDPDGTWKDISRKQTARTSLAVVSRGRDLPVDIAAAAEGSLSEGDTLQLNCVVGAPKSSSRHFKVIWLLNEMKVAEVDAHGVSTWEEEYEERAKLGQLRAFKPSNTVYVLTVREVGLKDKGTYQCSVSEMKAPGDLHSIQTNVSSGVQVNVKPIGLGLHATLRSRTPTIGHGQSLELFCQVNASYTLEEVPVSVRWLFQPSRPTGPSQELVQVLPNGAVVWGAARPQFQGKTQLEKAGTSFRLHIHSALPANEGTYQCEVGVWRRNALPLGQAAASASSNAVEIKVVLPEVPVPEPEGVQQHIPAAHSVCKPGGPGRVLLCGRGMALAGGRLVQARRGNVGKDHAEVQTPRPRAAAGQNQPQRLRQGGRGGDAALPAAGRPPARHTPLGHLVPGEERRPRRCPADRAPRRQHGVPGAAPGGAAAAPPALGRRLQPDAGRRAERGCRGVLLPAAGMAAARPRPGLGSASLGALGVHPAHHRPARVNCFV